MGLRLTQVDAFTSERFAGNPAAVCVRDGPRDEGWMRAVAREMNLPATTFLVERRDGFDLRWFTATVELELCGHGTLASVQALWDQGHLGPDEPARFHTRSGLLTATRDGEWIELDFPSEPEVEATAPADLARRCGRAPRSARAGGPVQGFQPDGGGALLAGRAGRARRWCVEDRDRTGHDPTRAPSLSAREGMR